MFTGEQDKNRSRKVAIYGRVSTEHEAQLDAFDNQMQWYDDIVNKHDNWTLVHTYFARGITGTQAKKRTSFLKMIEDAKAGMFDLIVTREVCRFARNTVDSLEYTRELKRYGVEVYFVEDGIYTFSTDGELRLTIFSALAQEESRKISERVRAGQKVSRENAILYGNGNILGYDLKRNVDEITGKWDSAENTYVINPEQAETVRRIYDLYLAGNGLTKICRVLETEQRKDATGHVSWSASKVGRILHNKTYAGYKCYNKSTTDDVLEHHRVNNCDKSTYIYEKGNWEPIIEEDKWNEVQELMAEKSVYTSSGKIVGKKKPLSVWNRKLRCSCGSTYRRNKWRKNKNSSEVFFGYQCYNQINNGSYKKRLELGLSTEGSCQLKQIADWKLEFMAKEVLQAIWIDRNESVKIAMDMIKECYVDDTHPNYEKEKAMLTDEIKKLEARLKNAFDMRLDNEITKEEYADIKESIQGKLNELHKELNELDAPSDNSVSVKHIIEGMERTLNDMVSFVGDKVDEAIIDKVVQMVIPLVNGDFRWYINLRQNGTETPPIDCRIDGRKGKSSVEIRPLSYQSSPGCYCKQVRKIS